MQYIVIGLTWLLAGCGFGGENNSARRNTEDIFVEEEVTDIHPNERGPIVTLSEKPAVTRSVFEPTQHLSESFVRYSKDDEITVCDSAVDSILSGALEQYYCLHPEERVRPIRLEKQQPIVPELAVAAGQQRRSVDFLTLPLEEVVANEDSEENK